MGGFISIRSPKACQTYWICTTFDSLLRTCAIPGTQNTGPFIARGGRRGYKTLKLFTAQTRRGGRFIRCCARARYVLMDDYQLKLRNPRMRYQSKVF